MCFSMNIRVKIKIEKIGCILIKFLEQGVICCQDKATDLMDMKIETHTEY